jgi:diphthamide synthase (EF-2-diphthine--ammonia ligase)
LSEFDPELLLRTLVEHGVDFCVIGAVAAWLQGSPAVTLDLDVMPRRDLDNAERLAAALNQLAARHSGDDAPTNLEGADFLGWQTQRFQTSAGPLDVVPYAAAIGGFEDVATIELVLDGLSVRVITIDAVIASKEELGRPKDTAALPALHATRAALRKQRKKESG